MQVTLVEELEDIAKILKDDPEGALARVDSLKKTIGEPSIDTLGELIGFVLAMEASSPSVENLAEKAVKGELNIKDFFLDKLILTKNSIFEVLGSYDVWPVALKHIAQRWYRSQFHRDFYRMCTPEEREELIMLQTGALFLKCMRGLANISTAFLRGDSDRDVSFKAVMDVTWDDILNENTEMVYGEVWGPNISAPASTKRGEVIEAFIWLHGYYTHKKIEKVSGASSTPIKFRVQETDPRYKLIEFANKYLGEATLEQKIAVFGKLYKAWLAPSLVTAKDAMFLRLSGGSLYALVSNDVAMRVKDAWANNVLKSEEI